MRSRKKKWALPFLEEHPDLYLSGIDPLEGFFSVPEIRLEIGTGKGDFIKAMAENKGGHYLGIEKDPSIIAIAGKKILESGNKNIRLLNADFDDVYEQFSTIRFKGIYINFPDPWPKKRHEKRRLTYHERLSKIALLLAEDGAIYFKTDGDELFEFSLLEAEACGLEIIRIDRDYAFDPKKDEMTEYESRFRKEGVKIKLAIFKRKGK